MTTEMTEAEVHAWLAQRAASAKAAAQIVLGWHLDRLRLKVGLVEIVPREHDHEEWQIRPSASGGRYCAACGEQVVERPPARLVPTGVDEYGQAWCVLVRDVEPAS